LLEVEDNGNIKYQSKLHLGDNLERQAWDSCATRRNKFTSFVFYWKNSEKW
jgi:hypothetical protein